MKTIELEGQELTVESNRTGPRVSDLVKFTATSPNKVEDVAALQQKAGYHPCGYGGPWNIRQSEKDGVHTATFNCAASCD